MSFVYFNWQGIKPTAAGGYLKSIAPSGCRRSWCRSSGSSNSSPSCCALLTLAVRLYGNMFAGHMALGIFALATTVFLQSITSSIVGVVGVGWFVLLLGHVRAGVPRRVPSGRAISEFLSAVYISLATSEH